MTISRQDVVYLDANFFVDWFIRKDPTLRKRARALLAKLIATFQTLAFSTLTIDEAWKGIEMEIDVRRKLPYSEVLIFNSLSRFTDAVLGSKKMRLIQFRNPENGVRDAIFLLQKFSLKPRDSFHLAIMRDNGITRIVTRDKDDFIKKQSSMGILVID